MKRILAVLFFVCMLLFALSVPALALEVEAGAAILIDAASGRVIYQHNADTAMPVASTTKILTALLALEQVDDFSRTVTLPEDFVNVGESSMNLEAGDTLTYEDLMYALMLRSANDAAQAIGIGIAGSEDAFLTLMNARSAELGLANSSWKNPHGLDAEGHLSSARDLAVLAREALKYDEFREIVVTPSYTIGGSSSAAGTIVYNHNQFLDTYEYADGLKTGYTDQAGCCLVASATKNDLQLIGVVLNCENRYTEMTELMEYGFSNYQGTTLGHAGDVIGNLYIINGSQNTIEVALADNAVLSLPRGSEHEPEVEYDYPLTLNAPVEAGDVVGSAIFKDEAGNKLIIDLCATESVEPYSLRIVFAQVWQAFLSVLLGPAKA